jgi:hypothetical protein
MRPQTSALSSPERRFAHIVHNLGVVVGCGYAELVGQHFDLVVNATSASLRSTRNCRRWGRNSTPKSRVSTRFAPARR